MAPVTTNQDLLAAARSGDEDAFRDLVTPLNGEIRAHCYRMMGSYHDSQDALQDTLLRAWRGLPSFAGKSSLRTWLYRIATNVCLSMLDQRSRRALPLDELPSDQTLGNETWIEPFPDRSVGLQDGYESPEARYERRESVELAFVAALQHLPTRQRATLILREVLGYSAKEAADVLETSPAAVNSALQHARKTVEERVPDQSQQITLRALGDDQIRRIAESYAAAMEQRDVNAILAMLTEDATWSMPPRAMWYQGKTDIEAFLRRGPFTVQWRHIISQANGQLAVGCYIWDDSTETFKACALDVLTLRGTQIAAITAFLDGSIFPGFGLPEKLE